MKVDPRIHDLARSFITDRRDQDQIKSLTDSQLQRLAQLMAEDVQELWVTAVAHPDIALCNSVEPINTCRGVPRP